MNAFEHQLEKPNPDPGDVPYLSVANELYKLNIILVEVPFQRDAAYGQLEVDNKIKRHIGRFFGNYYGDI